MRFWFVRPGEVGRRSGSSALPPAALPGQIHYDDDDDDGDDHGDDHEEQYLHRHAYHTRLFQQIIIYVASDGVT